MNTIELGLFLRSQDPASPNRYIMVGSVDADGVHTCFVHARAQDLGTGETGPLYVAVGRTARISLRVLQDQSEYVPIAKPYVIRRDDGHEITVG